MKKLDIALGEESGGAWESVDPALCHENVSTHPEVYGPNGWLYRVAFPHQGLCT
jgi:hypothetical protein